MSDDYQMEIMKSELTKSMRESFNNGRSHEREECLKVLHELRDELWAKCQHPIASQNNMRTVMLARIDAVGTAIKRLGGEPKNLLRVVADE